MVTKKTTNTKKTTKTATTRKTSPRKSAKPAKKVLSLDEKNNLIRVAAYYIAEKRGFAPGNENDDWVQAETQIEFMLKKGEFK